MALAPSIICDSIVNSIKHSNLHFLLSENAFSAKITIRKKFIDENRKQPFGAVAESEIVNLKVELDQKTLESDQIHIVNFKLEEANKALAKEITELESDLKQIQAEKNYVENDLRNHASDIEIKEKSFKQAIESFEYTIKLQAAEIHELKLSNENQKNISIKLNKEFNENQTKFKKEKLEMTKQFKKELKMWKKKLGTQTKKSMKLEKKLEESSKEFSALKPPVRNSYSQTYSDSSSSIRLSSPTTGLTTDSNIMTSATQNFTMRTQSQVFSDQPIVSIASSTLECSSKATISPITITSTSLDPSKKSPSNPTQTAEILATFLPNCSSISANITCAHTPTCILRQPKPPPPDKCSILEHFGSRYHEHFSSSEGVPSRYGTHQYCMRIDHNNYGCEKCVWYKWWGELHGYPDVNPWLFKEHLDETDWASVKI